MTDEELNKKLCELREMKEKFKASVFSTISNELCGGNSPLGCEMKFQDLVSLLKDRFDFDYEGSDECDGVHEFEGEEYRLYVFPANFSTEQDVMVIESMYME